MKTKDKKKKNATEVSLDTHSAFVQIVKNIDATGIQVFNALDHKSYPIVKSGERVGSTECEPRGRFRDDDIVNPLSKKALEKTVALINNLSAYLSLTPVRCLLLVLIIARQVNDGRLVTLHDIKRILAADMVDLHSVRSEMEWLEDNGYTRYILAMHSDGYVCVDSVVNAVLENKEFVKPPASAFDRYAFCSKIDNFIERRVKNDNPSWELYEMVTKLEDRHNRMDIVVDAVKALPKTVDRTLFYELCFMCAAGDRDLLSVENTMFDIISESSKRFKYVNDLLDGKAEIIRCGLAELRPSSTANDTMITLTKKGREMIFREDMQQIKRRDRRGSTDIMEPGRISAVDLYFGGETSAEIEQLRCALDDSNFRSLQHRLEEHSMPKGVAAIFYGAPGTGKTELAKQLARQTGRKVMKVDISKTKSCWVGESEKLIKKVFSDYRALCADEDVKPILLFNEADAIFTSRQDPSSSNNSSVVQMMNAMQNIILEEMETLDGILIATTNLQTTLDTAFERRFLYKIRFSKPDGEQRKRIWMSKLPQLTETEAEALSQRHNLSGGEIDNIVRKATIDEVLSGERTRFDRIEWYCGRERMSRGRECKIGF